MNSGLYAFAGASATATAAAWAKRLDWPMTKLSNVYLGFNRVSLREAGDAASPASSGAGRETCVGGGADCIEVGPVRWASINSGFTATRYDVAGPRASPFVSPYIPENGQA